MKDNTRNNSRQKRHLSYRLVFHQSEIQDDEKKKDQRISRKNEQAMVFPVEVIRVALPIDAKLVYQTAGKSITSGVGKD